MKTGRPGEDTGSEVMTAEITRDVLRVKAAVEDERVGLAKRLCHDCSCHRPKSTRRRTWLDHGVFGLCKLSSTSIAFGQVFVNNEAGEKSVTKSFNLEVCQDTSLHHFNIVLLCSMDDRLDPLGQR